ncbi:MAG: hypothetical protein IKI37_11315, partial [Oscillospiraceae bacterium]|nr:hypothetical protein [Oscillospiraceae bacterium]
LMKTGNIPENIPSRKELQTKLIEFLHEIYQQCPDAEDYMQRIVRRLAPEYKQDTVRTAILKKFMKGAGFGCKSVDTSAVCSWAEERLSPEQKIMYMRADETQKMEILIQQIDDSVFSPERLESELNINELLHLMLKRMEKCNTNPDVINPEFVFLWAEQKLPENLKEAYCGAERDKKLNLLVEFAGISHDASKSETSFAALLLLVVEKLKIMPDVTPTEEKQQTLPPKFMFSEEINKLLQNFLQIHQINYENKTSVIELLKKITAFMDENSVEKEETDLFFIPFKEAFESQMKQILYLNNKKKECRMSETWRLDQRDEKRKKTGWDLLRLCNDFASGTFRLNGGKTKLYLYYFAVMFNMTATFGKAETSEKDIAKNLFGDYYSDNLVRYFRKEYDNPKYGTQVEKEPSGEGINFKNFVEVIFLYYICNGKAMNLSPGQIIDKANDMIEACVKKADESPDIISKATDSSEYTAIYQENYIEITMQVPEDKLPEHIVQNYVMPSEKGISRVVVASENNTAYALAQEMMMEIAEDYAGVSKTNISAFLSENADTTEMNFKDVKKMLQEETEFSESLFQSGLSEKLHSVYPDDTNFLRMIDQIEERLYVETSGISIRNRRILCYLLHTLYHNSSETYPLTQYLLRKYVGRQEFSVMPKHITRGIRTLQEIGFEIGISDDVLYLAESKQKELRNGLLSSDEKTFSAEMQLLLQKLSDCSEHEKKVICTLMELFRKNNGKSSVTVTALKCSVGRLTDKVLKETLKKLKKAAVIIKWENQAYYLKKCEYPENPALNDLLQVLSVHYISSINETLANEKIKKIIADSFGTYRKFTRSALLSLHMSRYVILASDSEFLSFPKLYEDYIATVNPILDQARYQPISPKNILDMYILLSLYDYMLTNAGGLF